MPDGLAARIVAVVTAGRATNRALGDVLSEDDLREDEWIVLHTIRSHQGGSSGQLVDELEIPKATMSRLIDDLVNRGLVFRKPLPTDRRKIQLHLSRSGESRYQRSLALLAARAHEFTALPDLDTARLG